MELCGSGNICARSSGDAQPLLSYRHIHSTEDMSWTKLFDYAQPVVAGATILGFSLMALGGIGGLTAYHIKTASDTVAVTGSARTAVTADFGRLVVTLETKTGLDDQATGFRLLDTATARIVGVLKDRGYTDVEIPAGMSNPNYYYPPQSGPVMTGYSVTRQVIVRSEDVAQMQELANAIGTFSGAGYTVAMNGLELTYRKLDETRVLLLSQAIADAKARATAIASESGREVGALRSSASGVVQVLPKGGVDVSDYGTYDTSSMEKEVMVTVRATFALD